MKNLRILIGLASFFLLTYCDQKVKEEESTQAKIGKEKGTLNRKLSGSDSLLALPQPTKLNNLKQTDFSLTLENPISESRNIVYCPTVLYAWDIVQQKLKHQIQQNENNSQDFKLLNQSTSFLNALNKGDFSSEVNTEEPAITVKTAFFKALPFETELDKLDDPILFNKSEVKAFGMYFFDENILKYVQILHYKDDENFVLKLLPKDKANEIILVKGLNNVPNLKFAFDETNNLIQQGKKDQLDPKNAWKYQMVRGERFAIPIIKFNLETNYKTLEGQNFKTSDGEEHYIETAYQRIGFVLNEKGAIVESEAHMTADSIGSQPNIPHYKNLVFNRPFYLIIKKIDQANPSFVLKISNTELLTKE